VYLTAGDPVPVVAVLVVIVITVVVAAAPIAGLGEVEVGVGEIVIQRKGDHVAGITSRYVVIGASSVCRHQITLGG